MKMTELKKRSALARAIAQVEERYLQLPAYATFKRAYDAAQARRPWRRERQARRPEGWAPPMLRLRELFDPPDPCPWVLPDICVYIVRDVSYRPLYVGATTRGPLVRMLEHRRRPDTPFGAYLRGESHDHWTVQLHWPPDAWSARWIEQTAIWRLRPRFNVYDQRKEA